MADKSDRSGSTMASGANASVRSRALGSIPATLESLNSRLTDERRLALTEAVASFQDGRVSRPHDTGWVNVLARTFFSYSHEGFSPARVAWEAVIRGLSVIGCADVNNLGALGEMQYAGDALGIRATVSMEAKTFVQPYADHELNCPGQPGFLRCLGVGFTRVPALDCDTGKLIAALPERSRQRNLQRIEKINPLLNPVCIDYEKDVLPLTPAGNASPEHIADAYGRKAMEVFPELADRAVYWADVLGRSPKDVEEILANESVFRDVVWDRLIQLHPESTLSSDYPDVGDFFQAVREAGAIPCILWLGGYTDGESDPCRLLDDAVNWGARAVAVTPDSSWNISDPEEKERRLGALAAFIAEAKKHNLPILAGSPMSRARQKFVDSFDAPELAPYFRDFTDGAFWLYGHATLERSVHGLGATGEWAAHSFGRDRAARNAFYLQVGKKATPGKATRARIAGLGAEPDPGDILDALAPLKI